jgi:2,4-dienoyl-CoA reductase-like NADH-dependent reductase (Old Yellow Enzyme family)/thioredoxin reductase
MEVTMNLVKTLMGRRQFLIASGVASTCALTCKKLAGFETRAAMAAEQTVAAAVKAAGNRCPHLLSPIRIRNKVLKNRIMHTVSPTYFMQGPENYPTEMYRNHYSNMAKNAAIVTVSTHYASATTKANTEKYSPTNDNANNHYSDRSWDNNALVYNYLNEMIDDIHYQGALILFAGNTGNGGGGGGGGGMPGGGMPGGAQGGAAGMTGGAAGAQQGGQGQMPGGTQQAQGAAGAQGGMPGAAAGAQQGGQGQMPGGAQQAQGAAGAQQASAAGGAAGGGGMPGFASKTDDEILADAKEYELKGYDVYQMMGSSVEAAKKVRAATNLILMGSYRGSGGGMPGPSQNATPPTSQATAAEIEKAVEQAKKLEGIVDILWIRVDEHPNAWTQDKGRPKSLAFAEAIKKAGIKIITCPSAGFHDPIENDEFIASGRTDMVGMTMPFFADPELVRKIKEGRADDVVPCIACQNCHGISMSKPPWYSTCTVNPKWGLAPYQLTGITKPAMSKKVAIIGGGPSGMKAAMIASERGHKVTLFEKDAALGGLMKISDNSKWRWDHKTLKDYFINQVKKAGVVIKVNTTATPEIIKAGKFDTVLVATGADIISSRMKTDGSKVYNILEAYAKKDEIIKNGKNLVVVGAGKFGMEVGLGFLKDGLKVTILGAGNELVEAELRGAHNTMNQEDVYNSSKDFSYALGVTVKDITGGKVTYTDYNGSSKSIQADSIIVWSGLKPRMDEAEKFIGSADDVLFLGDCTGDGGTIHKTIRSAFFVASQV